MVGSRALLSLASKEVQAADHLLSVVYPLANDPRILLSVVRHAHNAIEAAHGAAQDIPLGDAEEASARLRELLDAHARAQTEFSRDERLVLADEGFTALATISPGEVGDCLGTVKRYVHQVGRNVVIRDDG